MLNLDMNKNIIKKYWKIIFISWLLLWFANYFWYNSIVYDEDQITLLRSLSIFLWASLLLLLVLTFSKYSFYLYFIFLIYTIVSIFFVDIYDRVKISTLWDKKIVKVISKDVSWDKTNLYYITYKYKFNTDYIKKKELVSYKVYNGKNIWDELSIFTIWEKSIISGSIPYLYIISIIIFTYVVINIWYTFIKKWRIINTSNDN